MPHTRRTDPMPTQLAEHIHNTTLCDTHEHLRKEAEFVERGPDILQRLFDNYVMTDLGVAGAPSAATAALLDGKNPDIRARFAGIRPAWEAVRHTGYGEAVRLIAREGDPIREITPEAPGAAPPLHDAMPQPGRRL